MDLTKYRGGKDTILQGGVSGGHLSTSDEAYWVPEVRRWRPEFVRDLFLKGNIAEKCPADTMFDHE